MRKDMSHVIVERPRLGGHNVRKGRQLPDEFLPKQEGIRRPYGYNKKELNENLSPLRRFLLKQAGRLWNDVYSEISENINPDNIVQQHILQHVKDYVVSDVHIEDGKVYIFQLYRRGLRPIEDSYALLYVHPETGILIRNPGWPRSNRKNIPGTWEYNQAQEKLVEAKIFLKCEDGTEFHRIDGIWYRFTWDVVPPVVESQITEDGINFTTIKTTQYRTDIFNGLRVASGKPYRNKKVQLNNRDLKHYNLTNEIK